MLDNLKIRNKLLIALLPLVVMVIVAVAYTTFQLSQADAHYTVLVDKEVKGVRGIIIARAKANHFGAILYEEMAAPDPGEKSELNGEADQDAADSLSALDLAIHESPSRAAKISELKATFQQAVQSSRRVHVAAINNDTPAALALMRQTVDPKLERFRQGIADLVGVMEKSIDDRSDELTVEMRRTILIAWIVVGLGLIGSFAFALRIVQYDVVAPLRAFRHRISEVSEDRCDQPIVNLERTDEIGEMSRALNVLQQAARERQIQAWVKAEIATTMERLQPAQNFQQFGEALLSRISESMDLLYGAFYVADPSHTRFNRAGGFALDRSGGREEFFLGEGLVGQAAIERRPLEVKANEHEVQVSAGAANLTPRYLRFAPMIAHDTVVGIVELAPNEPSTKTQKALLDALLPTAALSSEVLSANLETKKLLDHTRAQAATVAEAEERSRLILGSVNEGICGVDGNGDVAFINPAGARMLGYEPKELIGHGIHSRVHYAYADGSTLPLDECPIFKTAHDGEARVVTDQVL